VSGEHQHHGFGLPDPFGKFPSSVAAANVGFNDELLIATVMVVGVIDRRPIVAIITTIITTTLNNPLDSHQSLSPTALDRSHSSGSAPPLPF
jgi:hypothetical protein